jgi:hypothetical protein
MDNIHTTEMIFGEFGRHLLVSVLFLSIFNLFSTLTIFVLMLFFLHLILLSYFVEKNRILWLSWKVNSFFGQRLIYKIRYCG